MTYWSIDEASQISTTDLAAIQAVATAAGARIVLTGDTAQLGAVEAGGMMRVIAGDLGYWELAEVRGFDAEWERLALVALRRGDRAAIRAVLFAGFGWLRCRRLQQPGRPEERCPQPQVGERRWERPAAVIARLSPQMAMSWHACFWVAVWHSVAVRHSLGPYCV